MKPTAGARACEHGLLVEGLLEETSLGCWYRLRELESDRRSDLLVRTDRSAGEFSTTLREAPHRNVVERYDAGFLDAEAAGILGVEAGLPFLRTEEIDGPTLEGLLSGDVRVQPRDAIAILRDVAEALVSIHRRRALDGPLAPSTVRLASHAGVPIAKVVETGGPRAAEGLADRRRRDLLGFAEIVASMLEVLGERSIDSERTLRWSLRPTQIRAVVALVELLDRLRRDAARLTAEKVLRVLDLLTEESRGSRARGPVVARVPAGLRPIAAGPFVRAIDARIELGAGDRSVAPSALEECERRRGPERPLHGAAPVTERRATSLRWRPRWDSLVRRVRQRLSLRR
jgi:hypothetical protein